MTALTTDPVLFDRYGDAIDPSVIQRDAKGKPYYVRRDKCCRCGGSGIYTQYHGTCYRCAGRGIVDHLDIHNVKLYTREQNAKLDAAKAKREGVKQAKREAVLAIAADAFTTKHGALVSTIPAHWLETVERVGYADAGSQVQRESGLPGAAFIVADIVRKGRRFGSLTEKQEAALAGLIASGIAAEAAAKVRAEAHAVQAQTSQFVGTISEKVAVAVTCQKVATFERAAFNSYSGRTELVNVCTFVDAAGNVIITKTPTFRAEVGEAGILTGQVKQHTVYQDVKQTQIIRPKLVVA
jgi:hypothetical protein